MASAAPASSGRASCGVIHRRELAAGTADVGGDAVLLDSPTVLGPEAGLLHHSDQGCTYASEDYRARLEQHGIACSMSRRGNCYDNALMESWSSTVKSEQGERFESYAHAKALFDDIEVFYSQRRRHSTLGVSSARQSLNAAPSQPRSRRGARRHSHGNQGP